MPSSLEQAQNIRLHSVSGEIEQIENDVDGDPIFLGAAPFAAADDVKVWRITKITYVTVNSEKCPSLIERSGTRQAWDDRANSAIMGWR